LKTDGVGVSITTGGAVKSGYKKRVSRHVSLPILSNLCRQWLLSTTAMSMSMSMSMSFLECEGIHTEFQSFLPYCFGWNLKLQNLKFRIGFLHLTECPSYLLSMSYLLMFASRAGFLIQERPTLTENIIFLC